MKTRHEGVVGEWRNSSNRLVLKLGTRKWRVVNATPSRFTGLNAPVLIVEKGLFCGPKGRVDGYGEDKIF